MAAMKRIDESIEMLSKGEIEKRKRSYSLPIIGIFIGIIILVFSIVKTNTIGFEQTSYLGIFAGLFIIGWCIVRISVRADYYVAKSLNREIRPSKIFIDPDKKDSAMELFNTGKLDDVINMSINKSSPLVLELWRVDGHQLIYSQLLYKNNSKLNPITNPLVKKEAKII